MSKSFGHCHEVVFTRTHMKVRLKCAIFWHLPDVTFKVTGPVNLSWKWGVQFGTLVSLLVINRSNITIVDGRPQGTADSWQHVVYFRPLNAGSYWTEDLRRSEVNALHTIQWKHLLIAIVLWRHFLNITFILRKTVMSLLSLALICDAFIETDKQFEAQDDAKGGRRVNINLSDAFEGQESAMKSCSNPCSAVDWLRLSFPSSQKLFALTDAAVKKGN